MIQFSVRAIRLVLFMLATLLIAGSLLYFIILLADDGVIPPTHTTSIQSTSKGSVQLSPNPPQTHSTTRTDHLVPSIDMEHALLVDNLPVAPSLMGTDIPARFETDGEGNLLVSEDIRYIFDYFLTAQGELTSDKIEAQLSHLIKQQLNGIARQQANQLFHEYLAYLEAMQQVGKEYPLDTTTYGEMNISNPRILEQLNGRFEATQSIRSELFGTEHKDALFGEEEQYDQYHLDKLAVQHDPILSEQEKQFQLKQLQQALPNNLADNQHQVHVIKTLKEQLRVLAQQDTTDEQRRIVIANIAGEEAANRFTNSQRRNAEWRAKRQTFLQHRDSIIHNPSLDSQEKTSAIEHLIARMEFNEGEKLRLDALDRIDR